MSDISRDIRPCSSDTPRTFVPPRITDESLYLDRRSWLKNAAAGIAGLAAAQCRGWRVPRRDPRGAGAVSIREEGAVRHRRGAELVAGHHGLQQLLRVRHRQGRSGAQRRASSRPRPWTVQVDGACDKPGDLRHRRHPQVVPARGAHLPPALRGGLVDGHPLGRVPARRAASSGWSRRARRSSSSSRRWCARREMPGQRVAGPRLAVRRGPADGRGDAPADAAGGRALRQGAAEPERRPAAARRARGSTASRASSRSSRSASPSRSRRRRGTCSARSEYGFYANVNPEVDHPRWTQATRAADRRVLHGARR